MKQRGELSFNSINTIITLEEESIQICDLWSRLLKYSFSEDDMVNHIVTITTCMYQTFIDIICKENNLTRMKVNEEYIKNMSISDVITPITYERVVSMLFAKKKEEVLV